MRTFCSNLARMSEEPIMGSAPSAKGFLFISWPKKYWGEGQYQSKGFPESLKEALISISKSHGISVNLISRTNMQEKPFAILMPQNIIRSFNSIDEMEGVLLNAFNTQNFSQWQQREVKPSIFVCTHGKRDLCCAKY